MKRFDSRSSEKRSEKNDISHNFARNLNKGVFVEMIKLEKIFLAFFSFFSKGKKYLCFFGIFLFLLTWQWNGLVFSLETGFDMGVQNMELFTAASSQLQYGKDLLVTPYPPLSWLYKGVVPALTRGYGETVFQTLFINFFSALLRTLIVAVFWENAETKSARIIAVLASILVLLQLFIGRGPLLLDLCILLTFLLICRMMLRLQNTKIAPGKVPAWTAGTVVAISSLLAIPQLAKFSYITMAAALLIITAAILLAYKRYTEIVILAASYIFSSCLLWVLSGEQLRYLPSYIYAMLQFISGYSEVMAVPFSAYENAFRDFLFALVFCASYGLMLLYLLIRDRLKAGAWFIVAPFIFLIFKESFVRSDTHTLAFISELPIVLCYLLFVFQQMQAEGLPFIWSKRLCCGLVVLLLLPNCVNKGWYPISTIYSDFRYIGSEERFARTVEESKSSVKMMSEYQALLEDIAPYPDKTLGMLSGEQTFFIANDLLDQFRLNPIISLWENFTSYSELVAAGHYYGEDAPEVLLYRPEPLDNGYFIFRMGTILQSILENYHLDKVDSNGYLVLLRNESVKQEYYPLGEAVRVQVGEKIKVPKTEGAFTFMKVHWKLTPIGKLATFILKPSRTFVKLCTESGEEYEYRFFRTLSENGIYVSSHIDAPQDLADLVNGDQGKEIIESISLYGNSIFYQKEFEVSFYTVPFTPAQTSYPSTRDTITTTFSAELPAGDYEYFYAQNGAFTEEQMRRMKISSGQTQVVSTVPKGGWNSLRLDFPPFPNEYEILSIDYNGKAVEIDGANDAEITKTSNGWHIKTGGYDPFITFHLVK